MRRQALWGVAGALLFLVVDFLALPLLLGGLSNIASYVFFAPGTLGERLLVYGRDELGWSIPPGGLSPLPRAWSSFLICFNLTCYAALGFFFGWMLGGRSRKKAQGREVVGS
uniref:Uncharacterized protein n=1 Tax=Archangium gephyra TaxID=48 RepID=A0A7D5CGI2_9BACT|nr:hypothetical protein [Archangium gephyra]